MAINQDQAHQIAAEEPNVAPLPLQQLAVLSADAAVASTQQPAVQTPSRTHRYFGRPQPFRFIFGEDALPASVHLPEGVLARKNEAGDVYYLGKDDIICSFDDVAMPFKIENNKIIIEIPRNPFEKLYRPKEYDQTAMSIMVYNKKGKIPKLGLNLSGSPLPASDLPADASVKPSILYKGIFRFYMSNSALNNGASDSDSDEDERAIPTRVVAKRRYHMSEHLQLAMPFEGQEAFYRLIQIYLSGGFFNGSLEERAKEKSKRNQAFTEVMKQDVGTTRRFAAEMLVIIGKYYHMNCDQEKDYREGILQLLDFSHSLGAVGITPFNSILKGSPFDVSDRTICFRFLRKFGADINNIIVARTPEGDLSERIERELQENRPASQVVNVPSNECTQGVYLPQSNPNVIHESQVSHESSYFAADFDQDPFSRLYNAAEASPIQGKEPVSSHKQSQASQSEQDQVPSREQDHANILEQEQPEAQNVKLLSLEEQLIRYKEVLLHYPMPNNIDSETMNALITTALKHNQVQGYMLPQTPQGESVSEITKAYWEIGLIWASLFWFSDLYESNQTIFFKDLLKGITEKQFVNIIEKWIKSKDYKQYGLVYTAKITVAHLKKLFCLYTDNVASGSDLNFIKPMKLMHFTNFVQCILLFLIPNGLQQPEHSLLSLKAPSSLSHAIDCAYDALVNPKTGRYSCLYRGAVNRPAAEAAWRAYKATEKPVAVVPFFMRLPEVRIEHNIAFGLNLLQCFEVDNVFKHNMLIVNVLNKSCIIDENGDSQDFLGDWMLGHIPKGVANKPKDVTKGLANKPKDVTNAPVDKPQDVIKGLVNKPQDVAKGLANKPQDVTKGHVNKPQDVTNVPVDKPQDDKEEILEAIEDGPDTTVPNSSLRKRNFSRRV